MGRFVGSVHISGRSAAETVASKHTRARRPALRSIYGEKIRASLDKFANPTALSRMVVLVLNYMANEPRATRSAFAAACSRLITHLSLGSTRYVPSVETRIVSALPA
ncbi:MAG: hypothetical protein ACXW2P_11000, partial [Thermoanaerobaculia bacterium]